MNHGGSCVCLDCSCERAAVRLFGLTLRPELLLHACIGNAVGFRPLSARFSDVLEVVEDRVPAFRCNHPDAAVAGLSLVFFTRRFRSPLWVDEAVRLAGVDAKA